MSGSYFTVLIPFVGPELRTVWHPTEATGPFATLSRGAFDSEEEAKKWGDTCLKGAPYSIREIDATTRELVSEAKTESCLRISGDDV